MNRKMIEIPVKDLKPNDQVMDKGRLVYTVLDIVRDEPDEKIIRIVWLDGGHDLRAWDPEHFDQLVQVNRWEEVA